MSEPKPPSARSITSVRRDDLDALRGFAMLLGIVLHASLTYFPFSWSVQDSRQAKAFGLVYAAIHGFRMPLFFLLSGFSPCSRSTAGGCRPCSPNGRCGA